MKKVVKIAVDILMYADFLFLMNEGVSRNLTMHAGKMAAPNIAVGFLEYIGITAGICSLEKLIKSLQQFNQIFPF